MTPSWYDSAYRKLFFDFHSPGTTVGLAASFDAEGWAARVQEAGAQAVSVFTKCAYGYSFYRRGSFRHVHPHLPAGLDMLEAQIAALHRRGIRAIGYYHTFDSEPVALEHPEWVQLDAEGAPQGIRLCMLSPLLEEHMLPHVEEIITLYDVDAMYFDGTYAWGVCYCPSCRQRFRADTGLELPSGRSDSAWPTYARWVQQAYDEVRVRINEAIHRLRPEVLAGHNWAFTLRLGGSDLRGAGWLIADILPDDQVFNGSYLASHWATLGLPFDIQNTAFLQWWGDWGCKPAIAMQQEMATALAHGGLTWIGYQMTHEFDVPPAAMAEMGKALSFVREREPLLVGARPIPYVAVLQARWPRPEGPEGGCLADERGARGAHRLLLESMVPHHAVHEQALLEHLGDYRVVILPDQRYLAPELVQALGSWVRRGGVLIATALTGTLDAGLRDTGRFALEDLLGVRLEGAYEQTHAYVDVADPRLSAGTLDMPHLAEAPSAFARPTAPEVQTLARLRRIYLRSDGKPLLQWSPPGEDAGYPAVTLRPVGRGWAAYLASDVFRAYQSKNPWPLKHVVANLLDLVVPEPPVKVEAPAWLEVVLRRQPAGAAPNGRERTLVHLVNQHGDRPPDGNYRCTEQILPVCGVSVHLRWARRPHRVSLEPGGEVPFWSYGDGMLTVRVPEVHIHRVVAVE